MPIPEPSPMSIALDRAMKAAEADPLVEALEVLQCVLAVYAPQALHADDWVFSGNTHTDSVLRRARAVLAKYAPDRAGGAE